MEFNRVTFGLPVETFRVEAYIALEERLPVVTEFVLRLLRICGPIPLGAFRDYFGFSDSEALSVVESLSRQGLLEVAEEHVQLTAFSNERFDQAGGDHPRFSKVERKSDTVTFDLISFTPVKTTRANSPTDNVVKLDASEDVLGQSAESAKAAYRLRYPEIASMRSDFREKSFGVYSVEDVESKRRSYLPVPVTFMLGDDGQVERHVSGTLESLVPPELMRSISEQITAKIPKTLSLGSGGIETFIEIFNLPLMSQYLVGKKFDLQKYLDDVHVAKTVKYPKGMLPLFGSAYLPENRERVLARIEDRRSGRRKYGRVLTSMAWLVPNYPLWGRGEAFSETVSAFSDELRTGGSRDKLFIFTCADRGDEAEATNRLRVASLEELHFFRVPPAGEQMLGGRLEMVLYPANFVVAQYHLSVPGSPGMWAPIGFVSNLARHVETAHKILCLAVGGRQYGRRARFSHRDGEAGATTFEQDCAFLQYMSISRQGVPEDSDDDEPERPTKQV